MALIEQDSDMKPSAPAPQTDYLELYLIVIKRKWLIIICVAIGMSIAFWINAQMRPVFQSTATLMMNNSKIQSSLTGETLVYENNISQSLAYNTHNRLITSRPVLERVIRELKLDQIGPLQRVETNPFGQLISQLESNFSLMFGGKTDTPPVEPGLDTLVGILSGKILTEAVKDTLLMTISIKDHDPIMARNIANTLARVYIQYDISSRLKSSQNTVTWMSDQLYEMKKKLDDAEQEFLAYKQNEKLFSLEGRQGQISKKIDDFNQEYVKTKNRRMELDVKLRELQRTTDASGKIREVRALVDNSIITELRRQLLDAEVELSKLGNVYKPKHPKMVQIASLIDKINKNIKEELNKEVANINSEKALLEVRERSLQNTVSDFEGDALTTNKKEMKYSILERNVEMYRKIYDTLLSKLNQSSITNTSETSSELRIAEEAVAPGGPIRPRKQRNLTFGAVMGLAIGLGLTFLWNYYDRSIRTEEDVQKYFGLPVLAVIPVAEKVKKR